MRGFREVGWVIAVAGTTLGCYMVNLQVASERAALEDVSNRIVMAQRDIRVLQTEIGTRGRLEQLESWNVKVLALSAPQAHQFLEGDYQLATLTAPDKTIDPAAPVVLASAPAPAPKVEGEGAGEAKRGGATARDLMQVASLKRDLPEAKPQKTVDKAAVPAARPVKAPAGDATVKPTEKKAAAATRTAGKDVAPTTSKAKPQPASAGKTKDAQARQ